MSLPPQPATPPTSGRDTTCNRLSPYSTHTTEPLARLDSLIQNMSTILRALSLQPSASPIYITSLHMFLQRASDLHPSNSHFGSLGVSAPVDMPRCEDVDHLEKEWLESEVVAAWYGPRLQPRSQPQSHPHVISAEATGTSETGQIRTITRARSQTPRRMSGRGYGQKISPTSKWSGSMLAHLPESASKEEVEDLTKTKSLIREEIKEREQRLRRDFSYVGLNDDCL
nr:uncharacterized protein CI109_001488 [Kwoniella shandongensis]KAA5530084.1 hypothetical protein CI109_001488 [Kwoniella shandongensis]